MKGIVGDKLVALPGRAEERRELTDDEVELAFAELDRVFNIDSRINPDESKDKALKIELGDSPVVPRVATPPIQNKTHYEVFYELLAKHKADEPQRVEFLRLCADVYPLIVHSNPEFMDKVSGLLSNGKFVSEYPTKDDAQGREYYDMNKDFVDFHCVMPKGYNSLGDCLVGYDHNGDVVGGGYYVERKPHGAMADLKGFGSSGSAFKRWLERPENTKYTQTVANVSIAIIVEFIKNANAKDGCKDLFGEIFKMHHLEDRKGAGDVEIMDSYLFGKDWPVSNNLSGVQEILLENKHALRAVSEEWDRFLKENERNDKSYEGDYREKDVFGRSIGKGFYTDAFERKEQVKGHGRSL